jgi:hypothetical protein
MYALSGIRTGNPGKQAAADIRIRPGGHIAVIKILRLPLFGTLRRIDW